MEVRIDWTLRHAYADRRNALFGYRIIDSLAQSFKYSSEMTSGIG